MYVRGFRNYHLVTLVAWHSLDDDINFLVIEPPSTPRP